MRKHSSKERQYFYKTTRAEESALYEFAPAGAQLQDSLEKAAKVLDCHMSTEVQKNFKKEPQIRQLRSTC